MTEQKSLDGTVTQAEYRQTVEKIAELVEKSTMAEQYQSIDEGIHDMTKSHILVLDTNKASQVIALSENTPEGYLKAMAPEDDWKQHISMMARFCLIKDIREKIQEDADSNY